MEKTNIPMVQKEISRAVLGSMVFSRDEVTTSYAILDEFFTACGNVIDRAHAYAGGDSERLTGIWMQNRNNQSAVLLIDKGAHHHQRHHTPTTRPQGAREEPAREPQSTADRLYQSIYAPSRRSTHSREYHHRLFKSGDWGGQNMRDCRIELGTSRHPRSE